MGDKHDNSEYQNPTARTAAAPPPPEGLPPSHEDTGPSSTELLHEDIRSGMSDEEAQERAEERAVEAAQQPEPEPKRSRSRKTEG